MGGTITAPVWQILSRTIIAGIFLYKDDKVLPWMINQVGPGA